MKNSICADWFNEEALQNELKSYFMGNIQSSFHIWQVIGLIKLQSFQSSKL